MHANMAVQLKQLNYYCQVYEASNITLHADLSNLL